MCLCLFASPLIERKRICQIRTLERIQPSLQLLESLDDNGRAISVFTLYSANANGNIALQKASKGSKSEFVTRFKHFNGALDRLPLGIETFFTPFTVAKGCRGESSIQHGKMTLYANFFNDTF